MSWFIEHHRYPLARRLSLLQAHGSERFRPAGAGSSFSSHAGARAASGDALAFAAERSSGVNGLAAAWSPLHSSGRAACNVYGSRRRL